DRYLIGPFILRPTDWVLEGMAVGYGWFLRLALRHWGVVLLGSALLIALAVGFLSFDILGREPAPSEDQGRIPRHVICPVGSSITQVSELLAECERRLVDRPEVGSLLTTVATESGQLMNEADIFVQLVPRSDRQVSQQRLMEQVRRELREIEDIRV